MAHSEQGETEAKDGEISWVFRNRNVVLPLVLTLCVCGIIGAKAGSQSKVDMS
jgi:hypothetical protein